MAKKQKYTIQVDMTEVVSYWFEREVDYDFLKKLKQLSKEGEYDQIAFELSEILDRQEDVVESDDPEVMNLRVKEGNKWVKI